MQRKLIERDAAVLHRQALQQLADQGAGSAATPDQLRAVARRADQPGMLAMAVFDSDGTLVQAVPSWLPFIDLAPADYLELSQLQPISRFHPHHLLQSTFGPDDTPLEGTPMLEVLLPLHTDGSSRLAGVVQYWIDARALAEEIEAIGARIGRQTGSILALGSLLITFIVGAAHWLLARAQREIAERNESLRRANLELSLSLKASALGQITSHLLHGLQAPVAGLRAVMAARPRTADGEDWQTAADYTARLQQMIQQTVSLLGEQEARVSYELDATEIAHALRERHRAAATARAVELHLTTLGQGAPLSSDRANLLCLIAGNLIDNAVDVSPPGEAVRVEIEQQAGTWRLRVHDRGPGVPAEIRSRLFQPGRSTKAGGTGLGLAISHLLARQIGAELTLRETGATGTTFEVELPPR